jgi:hypothetical protein
MGIGLFSGSQGDLGAFDAAYELLKARGARRFVFAGGHYTDLDEWILWRRAREPEGREHSGTDELARIKDRFVRTPERDCLQYRDPTVPKKAVELLGDALCCVVHDKNDLEKEDLLNGAVFLHGKEPEPRVVQIGPRFFITPGTLTGAAEQTCGLLELADGTATYSAFTLDGRTLIDAHVLKLPSKTRLSVK